MDRRGFLGLLAGAAVGYELDAGIWRPKRTFFIPKAPELNPCVFQITRFNGDVERVFKNGCFIDAHGVIEVPKIINNGYDHFMTLIEGQFRVNFSYEIPSSIAHYAVVHHTESESSQSLTP